MTLPKSLPRDGRLSSVDLLPLTLLGFLFILFHAEVLLLGQTLTFRDLGYFFAPLREITFREIAAARLPLWNAHSLSGLPLFSDPNTALLNPFTWLYPLGGVRFLILGTMGAVVFLSYILLRRLLLPPLAALVGSAVYSFAGATRSSEPFPPMLSCIVWIPAFLFVFSKAIETSAAGERSGRRLLAGAALLLAFLLVAGEPAVGAEGILLALPLVAAAVARVWHDRAARWHIMVALATIGAVGVLLAAFQILPALHQLERAPRGSGFRAEVGPLYWSLPPLRLATFVLPQLYGDPFAESDSDYWGAGAFDGGFPYLPALYAGLLPLPLLLVAARKALGRVALAVMFVVVLLAFGRHTPLGPALLGLVPVLSLFRYPEKWMLAWNLGLAAAAAIGFSAIVGDEPDERNADRNRQDFLVGSVALLTVLSAAVFLLVATPQHASRLLVRGGIAPSELAAHAAQRLRQDALFQWMLAAGLVGGAVLLRSPRRRRSAAILLVALLLADLSHWNRHLLPSSERNVYALIDPPTEALRRSTDGKPVYYDPEWSAASARRAALDAGGFDPALPLTGIFFGLRYAGNNEIDRMGPRHAVAWAAVTARTPWGEGKLRRLRTAGVGAIATLADLDTLPGLERIHFPGSEESQRRVYRLRHTRPDAALLSNAIFVPDTGTMERLLAGPDLDPLSTAIALRPDSPALRLTGGGGRVISSTLVSPVEERHEIDAPSGGLFVRARTFDPDFAAALDGRPIPTLLADGMFTAVQIPPGRHRLHFTYHGRLIALGSLLSGVGLLILVGLVVSGKGAGVKAGS